MFTKELIYSFMDPHLCSLIYLEATTEAVETAGNKDVFGYILLLIVLIGINAFFASSELAVVSLNDAKLEKMANEGNRKAKLIYKMIQRPTAFLSTIQIGVTLAGFLSSAVAADTFADYVVRLFENTSLSTDTVRMISIFLITLLLSFLTLVFGELLPKRAAMTNPEKVAFAEAGILDFCYKVLRPLVFLVSKTVNGLAKLLGIREHDGDSESAEEEIRIMVDAGNEKGFIENEEKDMINNVFEFNDRTVGEIMTHRTDMTSLEINQSLEEVQAAFNSTGYSRIPVYEGDIDSIEGILYVKDVFKYLTDENRGEFHIADFIREPLFVYENMKCDDLMTTFQKEKVQVAIVLDEYGGTYGIVSMEDLLESIVGNIEDEFDNEEQEIQQLSEDHFIVDGAALIDDLSKLIKVELDDSENDTVGGLVMDELGYVPDEDETPSVTLKNVTFKILSMDDQSIDKIDVTVAREPENED
jgi:putative hemolysin